MFHVQRCALRRVVQLLILITLIAFGAGTALALDPPEQRVLFVCDQSSCGNPNDMSYLERLEMHGYQIDTLGAAEIFPTLDLSAYRFVYASFFWAMPDDPRIDSLIE